MSTARWSKVCSPELRLDAAAAMLTVHRIESLDHPELEPYLTLRRPAEHARRGIFVAEGDKVVLRLLDTSLPIQSVLVTPEWLDRLRSVLERRPEEVHAYVGERTLLVSMVGFDLFQGVLALARIPEPSSLSSLLNASPTPRLLVALDGLTNAENLGVVIRNCAAFYAQGLIVGETCANPWLRRSVRNSMGAVLHLPVAESLNLPTDLHALRQSGFHVVAAHPHANGHTLPEADLRADVCLVLGSEGLGISPAVLAACSEAISVPMPPYVDSLNVSSAAAVFLYEIARQRQTYASGPGRSMP
jgi:tRNA G18 (ribose-2'-O)-methylase SpoU